MTRGTTSFTTLSIIFMTSFLMLCEFCSGKSIVTRASFLQSNFAQNSAEFDSAAKWITYEYSHLQPMPLFRKKIELSKSKKIVDAQLIICGLGYFEAYLNGSKIGDDVLAPSQSNYEDYAFYSTYKIDPSTLKTENMLGVMLGNGWYNQYQVWTPKMAYGQPTLFAQFVVNYSDGTSTKTVTDTTWQWQLGPITSNNIYAGETYNALLEIPDWCNPKSPNDGWKKATEATTHPTKLIAEITEPIKKIEELKPIAIKQINDTLAVFDFGQNFAGWVRLKVNGNNGQKITLRFAEEKFADGNIDPTSTGEFATKVIQTDNYVCKGGGTETWEPRFTYHGFRYVEVSGIRTPAKSEMLTGIVVHTALTPSSTFECSDPQINKLHLMALWTLRSNIHGIPTDCPHRERCGWTGDAHTLAPALLYNFNSEKFLTKYLYDIRSSSREEKKELYFGVNFFDRSIVTKPKGIPTMIVPGRRTSGIASPEWGSAIVQIPWYLYEFYGNTEVLREFWGDMKTWVDYIDSIQVKGIVPHGLGDWCPPGDNIKIDCPIALSSTAFHYFDISILTKTAKILGFDSIATIYEAKHKVVRKAFNNAYFDSINCTYGSQTANSLALQLRLVPETRKAEVASAIVKNCIEKHGGFLHTGIFGLGRIFPALAQNGHQPFAYQLLTKKGLNSFENMWTTYDATTLWEVLPIDTSFYYKEPKSLSRSHNHPMNASFDEWFFRGIAGIAPSDSLPGFREIVFKPHFTKLLLWAKATYNSPNGEIVSSWKWKGKTFIWDIVVPENSVGKLFVPVIFDEQKITLNGKEFVPLKVDADFSLLKQLKPGKHQIKIFSIAKNISR